MSRSGYSDDDDHWRMIKWRGAVSSAFRGRRGQAFLREMLMALDALPEKKLIAYELINDEHVCAIGAVGKARSLDMSAIDPEDHYTVADKFNVAHAMACEIMWQNDEGADYWREENPEERFTRIRSWSFLSLKENENGFIKPSRPYR